MVDYLIGVYQDNVMVSLYDPTKLVPSGVMLFVLEAESQEEALEKGKKNWELYKEESDRLYKLRGELNRECGVLGYTEIVDERNESFRQK
jgi:hypothetical protein